MATTRNHRLRFMNNNWNLDTGITTTVSSALSNYPFANTRLDLRSKIWKPEGNFDITTGNQKLYFNDGSSKTANITVNAYTPSALATEIQTQMNALSSNWTCTYSTTTYKFTISRSSGTAILNFSMTSSAIWDTLGYIDTVDDSTGPFEAEEQRNHTSEYVIWDIGFGNEILAFAAIGTPDKPFTVSNDATVKIQANNVNDFSSPPIDVTLTRGDNGIFHFLDNITDTIYRYWKYEIVDRQNPLGPEGLEHSHLYLGDYVTLTNTNVALGFQKSIVDPSKRVESEGGSLFFNTRQKYWTFKSMEIQNMEADERALIEQLFYDLGQSETMYVSLDPTLCISTDISELTKFARFSRDPNFKHIIRDIYSMNFELREVI